MGTEPMAELDERFSSKDASATAWEEGRRLLESAGIFWLSTVRPDGRPHVAPLMAVWLDGALYFCTGPTEQKARNLERNTRVTVTTGCNQFDRGLDVVVEGDAVRVSDEARLQRIADLYESKYGADWRYHVYDGAFHHAPESLRGGDPGEAYVFEVAPSKAFGFTRGERYGQTRWRFG